MSWDVVLLRFRNRAVVPFNVEDAERVVLSTEGARETEPGVAAVVAETAGQELPDRSWSGWRAFDDDFDPPEPVLCRSAADLEAALARPYEDWDEWAHRAGK